MQRLSAYGLADPNVACDWNDQIAAISQYGLNNGSICPAAGSLGVCAPFIAVHILGPQARAALPDGALCACAPGQIFIDESACAAIMERAFKSGVAPGALHLLAAAAGKASFELLPGFCPQLEAASLKAFLAHPEWIPASLGRAQAAELAGSIEALKTDRPSPELPEFDPLQAKEAADELFAHVRDLTGNIGSCSDDELPCACKPALSWIAEAFGDDPLRAELACRILALRLAQHNGNHPVSDALAARLCEQALLCGFGCNLGLAFSRGISFEGQADGACESHPALFEHAAPAGSAAVLAHIGKMNAKAARLWLEDHPGAFRSGAVGALALMKAANPRSDTGSLILTEMLLYEGCAAEAHPAFKAAAFAYVCQNGPGQCSMRLLNEPGFPLLSKAENGDLALALIQEQTSKIAKAFELRLSKDPSFSTSQMCELSDALEESGQDELAKLAQAAYSACEAKRLEAFAAKPADSECAEQAAPDRSRRVFGL